MYWKTHLNRLSGFCSSFAVFKAIDSKDVDSVEEFVRGELREFLKTKSIALTFGSTSEDAFGKMFASNPSRFKFLSGDRKLIEIIVKFLNSVEFNNKPITEGNQISNQYLNNDVQRSICCLNELLNTASSN